MARPARARIRLKIGDITEEAVDAIVNAANEELRGGSGVDGAIHRAAGPELMEECRTIGGCPTGEARLTRGYRLPARYVIQTVGPIYHGGSVGEPELLASAYASSLRLAIAHDLHTIAFPAISCGVYGYPLDAAARIALTSTMRVLEDSDVIDEVRFVLFSAPVYAAFERAYAALPV